MTILERIDGIIELLSRAAAWRDDPAEFHTTIGRARIEIDTLRVDLERVEQIAHELAEIVDE